LDLNLNLEPGLDVDFEWTILADGMYHAAGGAFFLKIFSLFLVV
jgi:hypothetical protein